MKKPYSVEVPLSFFTSEDKFLLLRVSPLYAYVNGVKTEEVIGQNFLLGDKSDFSTFLVKVKNNASGITFTQEDIENSPKRIIVSPENCVGKFFVNGQTKRLDVSFSASGLSVIS